MLIQQPSNCHLASIPLPLIFPHSTLLPKGSWYSKALNPNLACHLRSLHGLNTNPYSHSSQGAPSTAVKWNYSSWEKTPGFSSSDFTHTISSIWKELTASVYISKPSRSHRNFISRLVFTMKSQGEFQ